MDAARSATSRARRAGADAGAGAGDSPWLGEVVEDAWRKLGGKVPRDRVQAVAAEAAAGFAEARVGAFLPILIERKVCAALGPEADEAGAAQTAAPILDLPPVAQAPMP